MKFRISDKLNCMGKILCVFAFSKRDNIDFLYVSLGCETILKTSLLLKNVLFPFRFDYKRRKAKKKRAVDSSELRIVPKHFRS